MFLKAAGWIANTVDLGPVVQSIVSLTSLFTVVAKLFLDTLILLMQKCEIAKATHIFFSKKNQCICHISR